MLKCRLLYKWSHLLISVNQRYLSCSTWLLLMILIPVEAVMVHLVLHKWVFHFCLNINGTLCFVIHLRWYLFNFKDPVRRNGLYKFVYLFFILAGESHSSASLVRSMMGCWRKESSLLWNFRFRRNDPSSIPHGLIEYSSAAATQPGCKWCKFAFCTNHKLDLFWVGPGLLGAGGGCHQVRIFSSQGSSSQPSVKQQGWRSETTNVWHAS